MKQSSLWVAFLSRWCIALVLVFVTFNPTQWNYIQWARSNWETQLAFIVLAGLTLLIGYIIFLRATFRSIGPVGIALVIGLMGSLVWVLVELGVLRLQSSSAITWVALFVLAFVLAVGLSWSIVRRRLSGQADMDDVDE